MKQHLFIPTLLLSLLICFQPTSVWALTTTQRKIINSGAFYVDEKGCIPTNNSLTSSNINQNEEFVYWFFVSKGYAPEQASGILGNMWFESGVNPRKVQGGSESDTPTSVGYGLVQWTPGTKIIPEAQRLSKPVTDLAFQTTLVGEQLEACQVYPKKPREMT
jgi:hypothetical protein